MGTVLQDVLGSATSAGSTAADVLAGLASDLAWKAPCAVATTGNVALTGLVAIDGVTPTAGARVLVWQQTDPTQNGIWNAQPGAWTRALDCDGLGKLLQGTQVAVVNGASLGGLNFQVATVDPVAIGKSAVSFAQSSFAPTSYVKRDGSTDFTGTQLFRAGLRYGTAAGVVRWVWARVNSETGTGNTGSDLELDAFADDGVTNLGAVLSVKRATRKVDFAQQPTIGGQPLSQGLTSFVASGASHAAGVVPDPGATAAAQRMLREDATWAIPIARGGAAGLKITNNSGTPNTQIDITARNAVIGNPVTGFAYVTGIAVTINLVLNQAANGIAEVTIKQASTWYYLYLIAKTDGSGTVAGLATSVAPGTAPALPTGYSAYEYVGAVYVYSDGNLRRTVQYGSDAQYVSTAGSANTTTLPLLKSFSGASFWTALAIAAFVPTTATRIRGVLTDSSGAVNAGIAPNGTYNGAGGGSNPPPIYLNNGNSQTFPFAGQFDFVLESTNIYYGGTGQATCVGWRDSVNAT